MLTEPERLLESTLPDVDVADYRRAVVDGNSTSSVRRAWRTWAPACGCPDVSALGIWVLSAMVILWGGEGSELAYLPVWFFALGMCLNLVAHPLLAMWAGGYFPGLVTAPLVGGIGVMLTRRLMSMSKAAALKGQDQ